MSDTDELLIQQYAIGRMQNFTYVVGSSTTREVVLVDPAWDIDALLERIDEQDLVLKGALITHYHPDHCGGRMGGGNVEGVAALLEKRGVKVYANKVETDGLKKITGISESDVVRVGSGDKLDVGLIEIEFLHTPGHTPGSQCFRVKDTLISGDTLFISSCGRVDLAGSSKDDMYYSLQKLKTLSDDTLLLPGHHYEGLPSATMAEVKAQNLYLRVDSMETWQQIMAAS